jgi:hypothetical protein
VKSCLRPTISARARRGKPGQRSCFGFAPAELSKIVRVFSLLVVVVACRSTLDARRSTLDARRSTLTLETRERGPFLLLLSTILASR